MIPDQHDTPPAILAPQYGPEIDLSDLSRARFDIRDIAIGLSRVPRFCGQTIRFYSVAQHCVEVANSLPVNLRAAGLMHDAAEAYLSDVPSPVKRLCPDYCKIEAELSAAIYRFFEIEPHADDPRIVHADGETYRREVRDLVRHRPIWIDASRKARGREIKPLRARGAQELFEQTAKQYLRSDML